MSVAIKMLFLLFGFTKKQKAKPRKTNATKFSKGLKQSLSDDVRNLTGKIEQIHDKKTKASA